MQKPLVDKTPNDPFPSTVVVSSLFQRTQRGCRTAWGRMLELERPRLRALGRKVLAPNLHRKESISDVVQQTLAKAYERRSGFRGRSSGELAGWLRGILLNTARKIALRFKRIKRNSLREQALPLGGLAAAGESPSKQLIQKDVREGLEAAVAALPEDVQRVIRMRIEEDMTFPEIGRQLGLQDDAVRMQFTRALRTLRARVGADGEAGRPT